MALLSDPAQPQRFSLLAPDVAASIRQFQAMPVPAAPAQAPQRARVSGWRLLDRVLGGETVSEGLDAERARLQAEADAPRERMLAQRELDIAQQFGGAPAWLALRANRGEFGGQLSRQFAPQTLAEGSASVTPGQLNAPPIMNERRVVAGDRVVGMGGPNMAPRELLTVSPSFAEETRRYEVENPTIAQGGRVVNLPTGSVVAEGMVPLASVSVPQGGSAAAFDPATGTYGASIQGQSERRRSYEDANGVRRYEDDGSAVFPGDEVRVRSQARGRLDAATASGNLLLSEVDKAIGLTGAGETGMVGAVMGAVPGTRALNLRKTIETIKANVGFNYLQQMRELSPTGGALGSLAVQEMQSLQSVLGNLDPNMGERELEGVLNQVKSIVEQGQALRERLYNEQFGASPVGGGQAAASAPASSVVTVRTPAEAQALRPGTRYRTPDGQEYVR
jgi:hypothetical protein